MAIPESEIIEIDIAMLERQIGEHIEAICEHGDKLVTLEKQLAEKQALLAKEER